MGAPRTSTSRRTGSTGTSASRRRSASSACTGCRSFFIGEQKVAEELGPMMRAAPTEEMRIFLCTQIADEARHVRVLQPLLRRGRRARGGQPPGPARGDERARQPEVQRALRRDAEEPRRPPRARARGPRDARRGGHALPHGHRGHAGPHRPALHHRVQRGAGHAARLRRGLQQRSRATSTGTWPSARASCARWPRRTTRYARRDPAHARPRWRRSPTACCSRPWYEEGETELFGVDARGDARLRDEGARAPAEGDRALPAPVA